MILSVYLDIVTIIRVVFRREFHNCKIDKIYYLDVILVLIFPCLFDEDGGDLILKLGEDIVLHLVLLQRHRVFRLQMAFNGSDCKQNIFLTFLASEIRKFHLKGTVEVILSNTLFLSKSKKCHLNTYLVNC